MSYTAYIIVYTVYHWVQSQYTHTYMTEWWVTQRTSQYTLCIVGYNHSTPIHTWLSDELHSVHHSTHCVSLGTITVHPYIHDWVMSYTVYITVHTVYRCTWFTVLSSATEWWVTWCTSECALCITVHVLTVHSWTMAGMFTRLKGGSSLTRSMEPAPTKEDILSSLEQFGEHGGRGGKGALQAVWSQQENSGSKCLKVSEECCLSGQNATWIFGVVGDYPKICMLSFVLMYGVLLNLFMCLDLVLGC